MKLALGTTLVLTALLVGACTSPSSDDVAVGSESALRELQADEVLGEIEYGDTVEIDLTPTPEYRGFYFYAERGDLVQATATAMDATDPILWITDESFNNIARSGDTRPTDTSSITSFYAPKTGKYFLAVRETYKAPKAKFVVSLRKLGTLPAECDPNGEGTWDSACTDPMGYDPFDATSCEGEDLTAEDAKRMFGSANGLRPAKAAVYYRTRQCVAKPGAELDCSPWVYAFIMDVKLATVKAKAGAGGTPVEGVYTFATDASRKSVIDFSVTPAALKMACVDGPFAAGPISAPTSAEWTAFPDGTPGLCATTSLESRASKLTKACARFELPSITLGSGEASHYTELSPVLHAKF